MHLKISCKGIQSIGVACALIAGVERKVLLKKKKNPPPCQRHFNKICFIFGLIVFGLQTHAQLKV